MTAPESALNQIRSIVAKLESLRTMDTEAAFNEAEVASVILAKLLVKHKLTMSEVELRSPNTDDPIDVGFLDPAKHGLPVHRRRVKWEEQLALAVGLAYFCKVLINPNVNLIWFVGRASDRAIATSMYVILHKAITARGWDRYKRVKSLGYPTKGFFTSFAEAAVGRLDVRLEVARRETAPPGPSRALVLVATDAVDKVADHYSSGQADTAKSPGMTNPVGVVEGDTFARGLSLDDRGLGNPAPHSPLEAPP